MTNFEVTKNVAVTVAALAVPIAVLVSVIYTNTMKEREVSGKFVEIAAQILSKEPTKTDPDARIRTNFGSIFRFSVRY